MAQKLASQPGDLRKGFCKEAGAEKIFTWSSVYVWGEVACVLDACGLLHEYRDKKKDVVVSDSDSVKIPNVFDP